MVQALFYRHEENFVQIFLRIHFPCFRAENLAIHEICYLWWQLFYSVKSANTPFCGRPIFNWDLYTQWMGLITLFTMESDIVIDHLMFCVDANFISWVRV